MKRQKRSIVQFPTGDDVHVPVLKIHQLCSWKRNGDTWMWIMDGIAPDTCTGPNGRKRRQIYSCWMCKMIFYLLVKYGYYERRMLLLLLWICYHEQGDDGVVTTDCAESEWQRKGV